MNEKTQSTYRSIGGSSIDVILQFPYAIGKDTTSLPYIYLGSAISISYSVYRAKTPVHRLGDVTPNGFAIGKKTVAGTIVKAVMEEDEINDYLAKVAKTEVLNTKNIIPLTSKTFSKEYANVMKDDLLDFNIILLFTSEYTDSFKAETIYGANIINNGQIMSSMDLFTETTMSFIAKDVKQMSDLNDYETKTTDGKNSKTTFIHSRTISPVPTASATLFSSRKK
jgi:hypothetical protein